MKIRMLIPVLLAVALGPSAARAEVDAALLRSLIFPGSGQAQKGRYIDAVIIAGVSVASGAGLFISQIHYNRAVERYDREKAKYLELGESVSEGRLVRYEDIEDTYRNMRQAYDEAQTRYKWRNVFLGTLIGVYTVNVIDMLLRSDDSPPLQVELEEGTVRLSGTLRF